METIDYRKQAIDFLNATSTGIRTNYLKHGYHFVDDKETRDIYNVKFANNFGHFTVRFGQSISNTGIHPSAYDILSCLTKYDPGTFDEFFSELGCDTDSVKAKKIYKSCLKEWDNVRRLWDENQLEQLREIK